MIEYYKSKILYMIIFFITLCIFYPILSIQSITVSADNKQYSNLLEDLQVDTNFNVNDYPTIDNDYSLKVIQIAESVDNELFVYVYQPSGNKVQASSINISTGINDNIKYVNYQLVLLNSSETLSKYLVKDFELKQDALRYYDISNIYRYYIENVDTKSTDDNTISEVAYEVGELWTASTVNGEVSYTHIATETIEITDKYVGFLRYSNGFTLYASACDSHYVAFSTDKSIDRLIEADVYYLKRDAEFEAVSGTTYGDIIDSYRTLTYTDKVIKPDGGLFGYAHTWNRIESTTDFIKNEELDDDVKNEISKMQWVLRFDETDYTVRTLPSGNIVKHITYYTEVTEVTILRLKFETNGIVYNLGVVDNKQSGSSTPSNGIQSWLDKLWEKLTTLGKIILCIIIVLIMLPFLPYIFQLLFYIVKYLLLAIWFIISLPFRFFRKE